MLQMLLGLLYLFILCQELLVIGLKLQCSFVVGLRVLKVAQVLVNDSFDDVQEKLSTAIAELKKLPELTGDKFGLVGNAYKSLECCFLC